MRLEKYLVNCGIASRKAIKKLIANGEIEINGKVEVNDATDVYEEDVITYKGELVKDKVLRYYLLNKPAGYITAMSNPVNSRPIVLDVLPQSIDWTGVAPVGRLDCDTEGLLIFTNDGDLNYELTYPEKIVDKEYYVELDREISDEAIKKLENDIEIDGYKCKPAKAERVNEKAILLTIVEGRYHQVKKMIKAVGNRVTYLKRVRFSKLHLGNLNIGELIEIKKEDII
ncbi:MAG: pseudouridine synthase [Fusobacteriaceae bacterium]